MKTKIRLDMVLSDEDFTYLLSQSVQRGYKRVEPRKRWSEAEYKEAIRWYVQSLVMDKLYKAREVGKS